MKTNASPVGSASLPSLSDARSFRSFSATFRWASAGLLLLLVALMTVGCPGILVAQEMPPVISSFSPESGAVGTEVTIYGENLSGSTDVWFNDVSATFREGFSGTTLIATVPAAAGTGPIAVATPSGKYSTLNSFTVTATARPQITDFAPTGGAVGTRVVVNGRNLSEVNSVTFNGVQAEFTAFGSTLTAVVPQRASTGPIRVSGAGGSDQSATPFVVTTAGAPVITGFNPTRGRPGTTVVVTGEHLDSVSVVAFNGASAHFEVFGLSLLATVPGDATTGPLTVSSIKGTAAGAIPFVVVNALAPEVTGFTPDTGIVGAQVTITGSSFTNVTEVQFGGVPATSFEVLSNTELHAIIPPDALAGPITVVTSAGSAASAGVFYVPAAITSFEPSHGAVGTPVTVHGRNFQGALAVMFSGVSATYKVVSATEVRTAVPEGATSGSISVATPAGFAISDDDFYLPPAISRIDPPSGSPSTTVTIIGQNLSGITSVRFGTVEATFAPVSSMALSATVPASAVSGPVTVVTRGGSVSSQEPFLVGAFSNLSVGVAAMPELVGLGDFLRYTLSVTNRGPREASGVVLTDTLPTGVRLLFPPAGADCVESGGVITCQLGALVAGAELSINFTVMVTEGPYLTNRLEVRSASADHDPGNNAATLVTALRGAPPLPTEDVSVAVALAGSALEISWPGSAIGFVLESAPRLEQPQQWTPVSVTPVVANGKSTVRQSTNERGAFYRLRKP
jgi:uncharacterized repeat protein (TIGR01451 family)